MYITYDYYRIFYYVAKYGNITQTSKFLLNNQSNLTHDIKTLESKLGCPLFIQNNRGMKLTPEGERLFEHIRIAFENIETESRKSLKAVIWKKERSLSWQARSPCIAFCSPS